MKFEPEFYGSLNQVPKSMPKSEMEMMVKLLREIRDNAKMENAHFFPFDKDGNTKMEEIREVSDLWRRTWLIAPLTDLINRYESELSNRQ